MFFLEWNQFAYLCIPFYYHILTHIKSTIHKITILVKGRLTPSGTTLTIRERNLSELQKLQTFYLKTMVQHEYEAIIYQADYLYWSGNLIHLISLLENKFRSLRYFNKPLLDVYLQNLPSWLDSHHINLLLCARAYLKLHVTDFFQDLCVIQPSVQTDNLWLISMRHTRKYRGSSCVDLGKGWKPEVTNSRLLLIMSIWKKSISENRMIPRIFSKFPYSFLLCTFKKVFINILNKKIIS